jgi:hypothetical protein
MDYKLGDIVVCTKGMGKGTIAEIVDRYDTMSMTPCYRIIIIQPGEHSHTRPKQVYHWIVTKFRLATKLERYLHEV